MIGLVILFLIIALVAAIFGFGGIVDAAVDIAVILFWVFLVLLVASLVYNFVIRRR